MNNEAWVDDLNTGLGGLRLRVEGFGFRALRAYIEVKLGYLYRGIWRCLSFRVYALQFPKVRLPQKQARSCKTFGHPEALQRLFMGHTIGLTISDLWMRIPAG